MDDSALGCRGVGLRRLVFLAVFAVVTMGYAFFRQSSFYIFNDSPYFGKLAHSLAEPTDAPLGRFGELAHKYFSTVSVRGYRPACFTIQALAALCLFDPAGPHFWHLLIVGSLFGALAVCMFLVSRRFVATDLAAAFATLLLLASPALAATSWIYLAFPQVVMPLLFCLGLLCYWNAREARCRPAWLAGLAIILLIGPWLREVFFVFAFLVGILELQFIWEQGKKRPTGMLLLAAAGMAHAVFPTALLKLLLFPELPLRPMYLLGGSVLRQVSAQHIAWHSAKHFLPLMPPMLWVLALLGCVLHAAARLGARPADHAPTESTAAAIWSLFADLIAPAALLVLGVILWRLRSPGLGVAVTLLPAVLALQQRQAFLAFWFAALYLPLLRVFTEHIHFMYALVPVSIVFAAAAERLWLRVQLLRRCRGLVRVALAVVCLLAASDQGLNLLAVYRTCHATYGGIQSVADRLAQLVPNDSFVVGNAVHQCEIGPRLPKTINVCAVLPGHAIIDGRLGSNANACNAFLKACQPRPVFLLEVECDHLPDKLDHRHPYVHELKIAKRDLGIIHETSAGYPYLDPLRLLVSRPYVPFMGAPDLVDDFYCGPARDGRPFCSEVFARYHLYEVIDGHAEAGTPAEAPSPPGRSVR